MPKAVRGRDPDIGGKCRTVPDRPIACKSGVPRYLGRQIGWAQARLVRGTCSKGREWVQRPQSHMGESDVAAAVPRRDG